MKLKFIWAVFLSDISNIVLAYAEYVTSYFFVPQYLHCQNRPAIAIGTNLLPDRKHFLLEFDRFNT